MPNKEKTLVYRWYDEVWNNADESAIDRMLHTNAVAYGIGDNNKSEGIENFKAFYNGFRSQFKDIHVEVEETVSEGEFEVGRCQVSATHIDTGRPVAFDGLGMVRIAGGKIIEAWNNFDFLTMNKQLGL